MSKVEPEQASSLPSEDQWYLLLYINLGDSWFHSWVADSDDPYLSRAEVEKEYNNYLKLKWYTPEEMKIVKVV